MTLAAVRKRGSASSTGWNIRKSVMGRAFAHAGSASDPSIVGDSAAGEARMTLRFATLVGVAAPAAARAPESPDWDGSCALALEPRALIIVKPAMTAKRNPAKKRGRKNFDDASFLALRTRFGISLTFMGDSMVVLLVTSDEGSGYC